MISSRIISSTTSAAACRPAAMQTTKHCFSTKPSTTTSKLSTAAAVSVVCSLFLLSDPMSSVLFANNDSDDVNNSYWAKDLHQEQSAQQQKSWTGSKLRNAHKFCSGDQSSSQQGDGDTDNSPSHSVTDLPKQARIVIVGGGFAGLHTALALAEKMAVLHSGSGTVDDGGVTLPPENESLQSKRSTKSWYQWRRWPFNTNKPSTNHNDNSNQRSYNANYEIIVLEAKQIGVGSSGRAKGLVVPGFQVPLEDLEEGAIGNDSSCNHWTVPSLLYKLESILPSSRQTEHHPRYTKDVVQEMYKLSYTGLDRLRSIVKLHEIDCDWVESGAVEGSIHALEDEEEDEEESDGCRILSAEEVNEMMGRSSSEGNNNLYQWGEYDSDCAAVNPLKLTIGLANAVERWGIRIYENTKLMRLEKAVAVTDESSKDSGGKYTLTTNDGSTLHCDHVVLCTGADTLSDVSRRLEQSFVPIHTWMAATEPLYDECPLKDKVDNICDNEKCQQLKRPAPMCGDDHISLNYWRNNNKDEGRLLFGSLADTFALPDWIISWRLRNAITEVYPQLNNVRFDHVWGGKLAFAPNSMPLIGRDTDYDDIISDTTEKSHSSDNFSSGVWYATGFAGHGIVPTTMAGSVLANAILEIPDHQQWRLFQTYFPPSSFNGYPYSRLGAGMVLSFYNVWDWAGKKGIPLPALPKLW